tara:strand:- start:119 stop:367 length:249 start_codon:yes stop_codon:yes gene_type:complete
MQTITVNDWTGENVLNREEFHARWDDARVTDVKRLAIFAKDFDQKICEELDQLEARLNEIKNKLVDDSFDDSLRLKEALGNK